VTGKTQRPRQRASIAELWAQATHDLRQPMQGALLFTRILEAELRRAEHKRAARQIATTLESLCEMLEALALLSRIETGRQSLRICACRLSDMLEPALIQMKKIANGRGIPLELKGMRGTVESNPKLLIMIIRGILLNAIKLATRDAIVVRCRTRARRLRLEVQFTGAALEGAEAKSAFVQLQPSADEPLTGGLGLGLCLVEHLCRRLGHRLHWTSLTQERRQVTIELPLPSTRSEGQP